MERLFVNLLYERAYCAAQSVVQSAVQSVVIECEILAKVWGIGCESIERFTVSPSRSLEVLWTIHGATNCVCLLATWTNNSGGNVVHVRAAFGGGWSPICRDQCGFVNMHCDRVPERLSHIVYRPWSSPDNLWDNKIISNALFWADFGVFRTKSLFRAGRGLIEAHRLTALRYTQ